MSVRSTLSPNSALAEPSAAGRRIGRGLRAALAALVAAGLIAGAAAFVTHGDQAGSSAASQPVPQQAGERPSLEPVKAAENFHHRR